MCVYDGGILVDLFFIIKVRGFGFWDGGVVSVLWVVVKNDLRDIFCVMVNCIFGEDFVKIFWFEMNEFVVCLIYMLIFGFFRGFYNFE